MRVILKISRACNNRCLFCHASAPAPSATLSQLTAKLRKARELQAHTVVLSGGEPTLHPQFDAIVDAVHAHKLRLGLITNGRLLSVPGRVQSLIDRGLDYACVSLHGARASTHNTLVGATAFDQTLAAVQALHGRIGALTVNTVVTNANLAELCELVDLLAGLPELEVKFTFPQPKGAALANFESVVPQLRDAAEAVAKAIRHGTATTRKRYGFEGFPLCLLPGLEAHQSAFASHDIRYISELADEGFEPVDDGLLCKPQACHSCSQRQPCPGLYRGYVSRKGAEEIVAPQTQVDVQPEALEKRAWVRLTYACNNRCLFCLDRKPQRAGARSASDIKADIVQGRRQGATRLVLSGGEASTHPHFLDFIRLGRLAGYRWIQTISNGRMFSYPAFVEKAADAGLDELTISMHGHTAALHDALVGVPGAFDQAKQAIALAVAGGRLVVNIDVVVQAMNVDELPQMLEAFWSWGIREFDLLHVVPFGAAWQAGAQVLYDPSAHLASLHRAFAFCNRPGARLWLNRFPAQHAEGFEHLIQDPSKLFDEVAGRRSEFGHYLRTGEALQCRQPDRCAHCHLGAFCDALARARQRAQDEHVSLLQVDAARTHGKLPSCDELELRAHDLAQALSVLERVRAKRVRLTLADTRALRGAFALPHGCQLDAVMARDACQLDDARQLDDRVAIVIELSHRSRPLLEQASELAHRLIVVQPTYDRLADAIANDEQSWPVKLPPGCRAQGMARCLTQAELLVRPEPLSAEVLTDEGIDVDRFASLFIRKLWMTKSLRCADCAYDRSCAGMHLNWVRAHGYRHMRAAIEAPDNF